MKTVQQTALERLKNALTSRIPDEVELNLSHKLLTNDCTPILIQLLEEDWHTSHRDVVLCLQYLQDPMAIEPLFQAAQRQFPYLGQEDSHTLVRICMWALATYAEEGRRKLEILSSSPVPRLAECAKERLQKWRTRKRDSVKSPHYRQVRAVYTEDTIRVYQAYSHRIAVPALEAGTFVSPPFSMERMTWIKPSFLWMMYRCGWATKPGQERVLAIDITREGFEWALEHACLSHFEAKTDISHDEWREKKAKSPVRIQWDPERDIELDELSYRSIQIGLSGEASHRYVNQWIKAISDLTPFVECIRGMLNDPSRESVLKELPHELVYPLSSDTAKRIGATYPDYNDTGEQ